MVETLKWQDGIPYILDQRKLPQKVVYLKCRRMDQVIHAIKTLATRGAPAIGVAASMGLVCAARAIRVKDRALFLERFGQAAEVMRAARPTAVNLSWAVDRMLKLAHGVDGGPEEIKQALFAESLAMLAEDVAANRAMGKNGAKAIRKKKLTVLTHCNAGSLATAGYGTALGVIYALREDGREIRVIADETRPLLQGARLTAWEMVAEGIPVQVIPDGASGVVMSKGLVDAVIVGSDRIAANGDVANKVGTFNLALAAAHHNIPFYVAAPTSTVDLACPTGRGIPIEERDPDEVHVIGGRRFTPIGAEALNFAFDVTPHHLVKAIITEQGVHRPPYEKSLAKAVAKAMK